jgi:hypothetical protein
MKAVRAAAVCFVVLYGFDMTCFDGRYFAAADQICSTFYTRWLAAHWSASF